MLAKTLLPEITKEDADKLLANARSTLRETRADMVNALVKRIEALQYIRMHNFDASGLLVPKTVDESGFDKDILIKMFESLAGIENKVTLKNQQNFKSVEQAKQALQESNTDLVNISDKVAQISLDVRQAKEIKGFIGSYIVPVVEKVVFDDIFAKINENIEFKYEDAKSQITRWYRHSIAGSLKIQQNIDIYILKGDELSRKVADQYFPSYEIKEVQPDELLQYVRNIGTKLLFIDTEKFLYNELALPSNASVFTPFPGYSINTDVSQKVVGIAGIDRKSLIESDRELSKNKVSELQL